MPLPAGDTALRADGPSGSRPAYAVRFPEDVWALLQDAQGVTVSMQDGMTLCIPGHEPIKLTSQPTGAPSEIHLLASPSSSSSLTPIAVANTRLTVPLTVASSSRAADKLKAQNDAFDKERKQRAERINGNGNAAAPRSRIVEHLSAPQPAAMARTQSSPAATHPTIPLKTRVIQLLALGPTTMDDMMHRVGATEEEVMRVVNVVGRKTSSLPDKYTLSASQYSKVKLAQWKYTYAERRTVVSLARAAFDELGLPADAEERLELDRKEAEGSGSGSSSSEEKPPPPHTPEPLPTPIPAKKPRDKMPKSGGGFISKQRAKFAAEKRATSLPNVKEVLAAKEKPSPSASDVRSASAAIEPPPLSKDRAKSKSKLGEVIMASSRAPTPDVPVSGKNNEKNGKRKREDGHGRSPEKRKSPEYTSSSASSDEERGRPRERKLSSAEVKIKAKPSRDLSSGDILPPRPRALDKPIPKRKPPPAPLHLGSSSSSNDAVPDPQCLRERYDELFPAYQLLTKRLARVYAAAEGAGDEASLGVDEVEKMARKWEKWHAELAGIRKWFTEA